MKKYLLTTAMGIASFVFGQVGIGTSTPDPSAILHLESSNNGLLLPRNTLTGTGDATTIPNPSTGLFIYHTGNTALTSGMYVNQGTSTSPIWNRTEQVSSSNEGAKIYKAKYRGRNSYLQNFPKPTLMIPELNMEVRFAETISGATVDHVFQFRLLQQPSTNVTLRINEHWQGDASGDHGANPYTADYTTANWNVWQSVAGSWKGEWGFYIVVSTSENRTAEPNPYNFSMILYGLCGYGIYGNVLSEPYSLVAKVF
ncbi:hypothetical protein [Chryseobacterium sp. ERMR1:04]|uniref:hypothetical protein n=1 Tax=Chryseobacterium sp. ERMR1:04 TaxID=1705393 RepID=UPI0006C850BC|nr:hypothetical protein [Chryseobacterium sp. ERMR1:04]